MNIFKSLAALNFLLLPFCTYSLNPQYEACKPFQCGSLNISYPFYVPSTQPSYCGLDGFDVSCSNKSQTVIRISGDDYIVNEIMYEDLTINITNSAFSGSVFSCPTSIHNLSFVHDGRFNFTSQHKADIFLFSNCSGNMDSSDRNLEIKCRDNEDLNALFQAGYEENFDPMEFSLCQESVIVPYYKNQNEIESSSSSIEGLLRRGIVLNYRVYNCSHCLESGGRCGIDETTSEFMCFCSDRSHKNFCRLPIERRSLNQVIMLSGGSLKKVIIFSALSGVIVTILILIVCWLRRRQIKGSSTKFKWDNQKFDTFIENYGSHVPKRYAHSEIKKMTNSFAEKIGEGGYGAVYKGKLLDGRLVAVKLMKNLKGDKEGFINEVASIGRTNHVNVVTLLGFCNKGDKTSLVYEFMENGSLDKYSNEKEAGLSFERLFQIMLGIARGLEYLHRGCKTRILHLDIKPHNILLDEEFCPKISDFGLAKLAPQSKQSKVSMSGARGTIGYIAPEVFCRTLGDVSHKSDVYSYGMMVLEVIGSRKNTNTPVVHNSSELYFPEYIYKQLENEEEVELEIGMSDKDRELKRKMMIVSLWCIQPAPSSRPSMSGVVKMLEESVETIQVPPVPSHSSPPRPHMESSWSSSTMTS